MLGVRFSSPHNMKWSDKINNGKILCIVNPDEYDKRWGWWVEYGIETMEEYLKLKSLVISSGRWEEFCRQNSRPENVS